MSFFLARACHHHLSPYLRSPLVVPLWFLRHMIINDHFTCDLSSQVVQCIPLFEKIKPRAILKHTYKELITTVTTLHSPTFSHELSQGNDMDSNAFNKSHANKKNRYQLRL